MGLVGERWREIEQGEKKVWGGGGQRAANEGDVCVGSHAVISVEGERWRERGEESLGWVGGWGESNK